MKEKEQKRRAWSTYVGCLLLLTFLFGTSNNQSIYFASWMESTGGNSVQVSLFFTIMAGVLTACNLLVGTLNLPQKFPMKVIAIFGAVCFGGSFLIIGLNHSLVTLYIGAALFGISLSLCGNVVCQPAIAMWHAKNLGVKQSGATVAYSLGAAAFAAIFARMLEASGYKTTYLTHGIIFAVLMILSSLLLSDAPEKYGLKPLGYTQEAATEKQPAAGKQLSAAQALKTLPCWLIMAAIFLLSLWKMAFIQNMSIAFQAFGLDAVGAANRISIYNIVAIVWILLYGYVTDKFSIRISTTIWGCISALAFLIGYISRTPTTATIVAVLISCSTYLGVVGSLCFSTLYGGKSLVTLVGLSFAVNGVASMMSAPLYNAMVTAEGSPRTYMLCTMIFVLISTALIAIATSKKSIAKIKSLSESIGA